MAKDTKLTESDKAGTKAWRVGVSGLSDAGLHLLERLSLSTAIELIGAYDPNVQRRLLSCGLGCHGWDQTGWNVHSSKLDVVFLIDDLSSEAVARAIDRHQHVVIQKPWLLSSEELTSLHALAISAPCVATVAPLWRWSAEFETAMAAVRTGRLGALRSITLSSYERRIPDERSSENAVREFAYQWLDQLLLLSPSKPARVFARMLDGTQSTIEEGFVASIEFAEDCHSQIAISTRSRLGHRTGWMIEGTNGSYRSDRLYTETADGEIVDEPFLHTRNADSDPFLSELIAAWNGQPNSLPTLAQAAQTVRLMESIEQSSRTGRVIGLWRR